MATMIRTKRGLRRRGWTIRDHRGLPAKQLDVQHAVRRFHLLQHWAKKNGISIITEAGRPVLVLFGGKANPGLLDRVETIKATEAARRRNPHGVFALADEVFGSRWRADQWMRERIVGLDYRRPVDLLVTAEGVEEVLALLNRIVHGFY